MEAGKKRITTLKTIITVLEKEICLLEQYKESEHGGEGGEAGEGEGRVAYVTT